MKNINFLSENFHFFMVTFSVYLNRLVFVMEFDVADKDLWPYLV